MFKYILKRLAIAVLVLFGVSIIIYSLVRLMPSDFVDQKYQPLVQNGQMDPARLEELKELYGLSDKSFEGMVKGYLQWVGNALQGAFCIVCALFLVSVFYRLKPVKRIFPMLGFTKAANGA